MGKIATSLADFTVITSDNSRGENPRAIICDIMRGVDRGAEYKFIERREDAIRYIIEHSDADDIILLAGKGHEDYEIDADGKHPFSERDMYMTPQDQCRGSMKQLGCKMIVKITYQ